MGLTTSSSSSTSTTPGYYTDYLTDLATRGKAATTAATAPGGAGTLANMPNANQTAAFNKVGANVGNYVPGLEAAGLTTNQAGGVNMTTAANPYLATAQGNLNQGAQGADQLVGNYMNPYTQSVVDQLRMANQQNIQQTLSPGITTGAVGAGQFGSQRGANALAMGISNANTGALAAQSSALQAGYTQALQAAQAQRQNQLTAGATGVQAGTAAANAASQTATNYLNTGKQQASLADQTQTAGLADVNALANLGAQQQTIALNAANYPMSVLGEQAKLMSGQAIPISTTNTATGSTLGAIAGLGSLATSLFTKNAAGVMPWDSLSATAKAAYNAFIGSNTADNGATLVGGDTSATGFINAWGQPVNSDGSPYVAPATVDNSAGGGFGGEDTTDQTESGT